MKESMQREFHPGFEIHGRYHPKSITGVSEAPLKGQGLDKKTKKIHMKI